jgi:hypothetical protein
MPPSERRTRFLSWHTQRLAELIYPRHKSGRSAITFGAITEEENATVAGEKVAGDESSRLRSNTVVRTSTKVWEVEFAVEGAIFSPCTSCPLWLLNAPGGNVIVARGVGVTAELEGDV